MDHRERTLDRDWKENFKSATLNSEHSCKGVKQINKSTMRYMGTNYKVLITQSAVLNKMY